MRIIIFVSVIIILDFVTKHLAVEYLTNRLSVEVIPGFFNFTLVYNKGAAFGLFSGLEDTLRRFALTVVSVFALLAVVYFMRHEAKNDVISRYCLFGILAGAFGNICDRVRFDYVVDFLDFYWKDYHWPAFNVADSAISIGVTILIIRSLFGANKPKENNELS